MSNTNECCGDCRECSKCEGLNIHTAEELDYIFGTLKKMREENIKENQKNDKRTSWKVIKGKDN